MKSGKKGRQHQAIQYLPKEETKNIYTLIEKIEKIAKDEYVFHHQIFKMGNDGAIQTETEPEEFDRMHLPPIYSADEIGLSKNKNELDICKYDNDIEYSNILRDEKKWLAEQEEAPISDDIKNILKYIDNVKGRFIIWYSDNNLKRTTIDDTIKKKKFIPLESIPDKFQVIVNDLQDQINLWYSAKVKVKKKIADEIDFIYSNSEEEIKQKYSKMDFVKVIYSFLKLRGEDKNWSAEQLYKNMK